MKHWFRYTLAGAVLFGAVVGALSSRLTAHAQTSESQAFTVMAGGLGWGNIEVLAFAPQSLQVHRGDAVTWIIPSFHNIRFGNEPIPLVIVPEVDGQPLPQINPAVAFPSIDNGAVYQGGEANSGLPEPFHVTTFSLTIDLEPGTYSYLCDVHPGMVGLISVVPDDMEIASPTEVTLQAAEELGASISAAMEVALDMEAESLTSNEAGQITIGSSNTGRATVNLFTPFNTVITAGESVTWTNPEGSVEPHLVGWPPVRNQDVEVIMVEEGPPILGIGPSLAPMTPSGSTIAQGDRFNSGLLMPGESYSLTFSEPGVYSFTCNIHPGMNGTVVVQPAS
jgi:plastocyanin